MKTEKVIPKPEAQITINTLDALKVYFDPLRLKIVQEMAHEPRTVQQVAEALGVPFTRLYYHVNMLEKHGIIRVVEVRSMSGAVEEKYYQVAARMMVIDRSLLTLSGEGESGLEFFMSKMLDDSKNDIRKSIEAGIINMNEKPPHPDSLLLRRGILRLSRERAQQFHEDLIELINRYQEDSHTPDDPYYAIVISLYPTAFPYGDSANGEGEE